MDYTPDRQEVRKQYAFAMSGDRIHRTQQYLDEFDRWLAAHDSEVAARAWQEGAQWAAVELGEIRRVENQWVTDSDNPYRDTPKGD